MDVKENIWHGKSILVTGHTGFKGAWLSCLLRELGANVIGLSLPPSPVDNSLYFHAKVRNKISKEYFLDIRKEKRVFETINETKPDYVFHLAAQSLVLKSIRLPLDTFSTNILGTLNVLLASLNTKTVKGILISTTDKVYNNQGGAKKFIETDKLGGSDPYSASKASVEILVSSILKTNNPHNKPIATVRAGNVIGGGDWNENRLVPDLIQSLKNRRILEIRNPSSTRPWQYVLDCLRGYLMIGNLHLNKKVIPEMFNIGPSKSLSVENLIKIFELVFKEKIPYKVISPKVYEATYLNLNSQMARSVLGWEPIKSTRESVKITAYWYKDYLNGQNSNDLMLRDIYDYGIENFY
jgi:CDP-glucose 4,6-dehydratase